MAKYIWQYDPHSGGVTIPRHQYDEIKRRLMTHIKVIAPNVTLEIKFRSQFCYINTLEDNQSMPACRMRYFDKDVWSFAFYTYSNEKYEPCLLLSGNAQGTPEEILEACIIYF